MTYRENNSLEIAISSQILCVEEIRGFLELPVRIEVRQGEVQRIGASPARSNLVVFSVEANHIDNASDGNSGPLDRFLAEIEKKKEEIKFVSIWIRPKLLDDGSSFFISPDLLRRIALAGVGIEVLG